MFEQFIRYVLSEIRLIAEAPLVFGAAVLFLGAIIWAALRWRYSSIIEHRNDIIALYKARLNGATPDQAKAKIDSLEGQVVSLKNRGLLDQDQLQQKIDSLAAHLLNYQWVPAGTDGQAGMEIS